jgi:hypothetical protein
MRIGAAVAVLVGVLAGVLISGCGGGGVAGGALADNRDSSSGTTTAPPAPPAPPSAPASTPATGSVSRMELVDGAGQVLAAPTLSQTEARFLKVTAANLQKYKRVEVTLDNKLAVITPASGATLTNENGVALFAIAPAAVAADGVVRATAKIATDGGDVTATLDLQIVPGNVQLAGLSVSPASVQIGQSVTVSVNALVNNVAARSNAISVAFTSNCGSVSPAAAPVDGAGKATAVIQTSVTGACTVAASGGSATASAGYTVTAAPVLGLQFVKSDPQVIYLKDSIGTTNSTLTFRVIDANGKGVAGQLVNASLLGAGLADFCGLAAQAITAGSTGEVSFHVCSGSQPTTVQVRATVAGTAISTDSNLLTVQSGLPSQRFFDVAAGQLNFYAGGYFTDKFAGLSVPITAFAADRQGNPVPDGTPVIFVAEGGQINRNGQSSCVIRQGSCSVDLIGQDYRPMGSAVPGADPRPGRVTVLAMTDGEEHFIDANNNNRYDPGELFEDLGRPFLDKDEDGVFTAAYRNLVTDTNEGDASYPMAARAEGTVDCKGGANRALSVANTCNGEWNGSGLRPDGTPYTPTKVRRSITIVFSGGEIGYPNAQKSGTCGHSFAEGSYHSTIPEVSRTELISCTRNGIVVRLADRNGNPLPADAALAATIRKSSTDSTCTAALAGAVIGNSTEPTTHQVLLNTCGSGDILNLSVTVRGKATTFTVAVP